MRHLGIPSIFEKARYLGTACLDSKHNYLSAISDTQLQLRADRLVHAHTSLEFNLAKRRGFVGGFLVKLDVARKYVRS